MARKIALKLSILFSLARIIPTLYTAKFDLTILNNPNIIPMNYKDAISHLNSLYPNNFFRVNSNIIISEPIDLIILEPAIIVPKLLTLNLEAISNDEITTPIVIMLGSGDPIPTPNTNNGFIIYTNIEKPTYTGPIPTAANYSPKVISQFVKAQDNVFSLPADLLEIEEESQAVYPFPASKPISRMSYSQSQKNMARRFLKMPLIMKEEILPSEFKFNEKLAIASYDRNTINSVKFKALKYPYTINKNNPQLHKIDFTVFDLETIVVNNSNLLVPYMIGWDVVKYDSETHTHNHSSNTINLPLNATPDNVKDAFLTFLNVVVKNKSPLHPTIVFAHNGGKFDWKIIMNPILKLAETNILEIDNVITNSSNELYQITIIYQDTTIYLRDSYKLIRASVSNISKIFLGQDNKMVVNHTILNEYLASNKASLNVWNETLIMALPNAPHNLPPINYLSSYCIMDCKIVTQALIKFSENIATQLDVKLSGKSIITISGTSINVWLQKFNNIDSNPVIEIPMETSISAWLKESYLGGRTEVFHSGVNMSNVYHFDVPGIYASCIQKYLPIGNPLWVAKWEGSDELFTSLINHLHKRNMIGFFKCTVTAPTLHIPVLGIKHDGKLIFPLGTFTGKWTSIELQLALEIGYTITPIEGYIFKTGTPLKDFSITLTEIKDNAGKSGDIVTRNIAKLLLNSLYGKFASNYYDTTTAIITHDQLAQLEKLYDVISISETDSKLLFVTYSTKPIISKEHNLPKELITKANHIHILQTEDKTTNIALASAITSHARIVLYKLFLEIEKMGGKVIYTDTDSIFATLPENPFGKPFGPFIWDGKPNANTFNKVLFIAPKMYYLQDLDGKITFKVKGTNTSNQKYSYEELLNIFKSNTPILFKDQLAFKIIKSENKFIGLGIYTDIIKSYKLFSNTKRSWFHDNGTYYTNPLLLDIEILNKSSINKLETYAFEDLKATTKAEFKANIVNKSSFIKNDFTSWVSDEHNTISISFKAVDLITTDFKKIWLQAVATAAHNTNNFEDSNNILRIIVVIGDSKANRYTTTARFASTVWCTYKIESINSILIDAISKTHQEYNGVNFDTIIFKLYFKRIPALISDSNIDIVYDIAFNKIIDTKAEQEKLETLIKQSTDQLLAMQEKSAKSYESFKAFEDDIKIKFPKIKAFKMDAKIAIKEILKIDPTSPTGKDLDLLVDNTYNAFIKTIMQNGQWTFHSFQERIIDAFKCSRRDQNIVVLTLSHSIHILIKITGIGLLTQFSVIEKGGTTDLKINSLNHFLPADPIVLSWLNLKVLISKVSLAPKVLTPDNSNVTSKSIIATLNKLNSTPVTFNINYIQWLTKVWHPFAIDKNSTKVIELNTNDKINRFISASKSALSQLEILINIIEKFGAKHFYIEWTHDFRGRLYPKLTTLSHIAHKYLRPAFLLSDQLIFKKTLIAQGQLNPSDIDPLYLNYKIVLLSVDLYDINWNDILNNAKKAYADIINPNTESKMDYNKINRIWELIKLEENDATVVAPYELDATCNVMQHIAAITGNKEIIEMTKVIPSNNPEDFYTNIANKTIEVLKDSISETLDISTLLASKNIIEYFEDDNNTKILRRIVKRPAMTKAYAAKYLTAINSVLDSLKENNIPWDNFTAKVFTDAIIIALASTIDKEILLILQLQKAVKNYGGIVEWIISPNSDFKVVIRNFKKEEYKLKVPYTNSQGKKISLHTSYKLIIRTQDLMKNANSIFVNIIHSLDALHISLIIQGINHSILPIHDAALIPIEIPTRQFNDKVNETFSLIHNKNITYTSIASQLREITGEKSLTENLHRNTITTMLEWTL